MDTFLHTTGTSVQLIKSWYRTFQSLLMLDVTWGGVVYWQTCQILSNYWMAWASSPKQARKISRLNLISVYTGLAFGSTFFIIIRSLLVEYVGLRTAQQYFLSMMRCLFRAPMSFFDSTPTGRILNRVLNENFERLLEFHSLRYHSCPRILKFNFFFFPRIWRILTRCAVFWDRPPPTKVSSTGRFITNSMDSWWPQYH